MIKNNTPRQIALDRRIIFALDVQSVDMAKSWVAFLEDKIKFFKVGLQLFLAGGFSIVDWILARRLEVMLDLKLYDVPQTVSSAVKQVQKTRSSLLTVHGNNAILEAAAKVPGPVEILAVTVLTSLDQADLEQMGYNCSPEKLVLQRAQNAIKMGCAGIVCSGLELPRLRKELGDTPLLVVPGVRPASQKKTDDQKRTVDVRQAIENGADHVVIGRPISMSSEPLALIEKMQEDIQKSLSG